ncbi:MAG: lysophospholipid acyltransferase family protein [Candidatus Riflebacteria bacterium]|nr:lysophospholipid acyltransferase family protein [Candidatus Riflebacteria bacterium]
MFRSLFLKISRVFQTLSEPHGRMAAASIGFTMGRVCLKERKRLFETIDRVYFRVGKKPPFAISGIIDRLFIHFSLVLFEVLRFPLISSEQLKNNIHFHGVENLEKAISAGTGVILPLPHLGSWELLGAAIAFRGYPLHTFFLSQKEDDLGSTLDYFRQFSRLIFHERDRGMIGALKALKNGELLGMIADQDGGNHGVYLDFLGHWVSMPTGPANWSLKSGAQVVPVYCVRRGFSSKYDAFFLPALKPETAPSHEEKVISRIRKLSIWMQDIILANPSQYLWFYDRFKPRHVPYLATLQKSGISSVHGDYFYRNPSPGKKM